MHRYTITVEALDPSTANTQPLVFTIENHDEVFSIVDRIGAGGILPEQEVAEFAVGLKLFTEVVLRHRREPMFSEMFAAIGPFMKQLKAAVAAGR